MSEKLTVQCFPNILKSYLFLRFSLRRLGAEICGVFLRPFPAIGGGFRPTRRGIIKSPNRHQGVLQVTVQEWPRTVKELQLRRPYHPEVTGMTARSAGRFGAPPPHRTIGAGCDRHCRLHHLGIGREASI